MFVNACSLQFLNKYCHLRLSVIFSFWLLHGWHFGLFASKDYLLIWFPIFWLCTHPMQVIKENSMGPWTLAEHRSLKSEMFQTPVSPPWQICYCICGQGILIKGIAIDHPHNNPTYSSTKLTKGEILDIVS
jgi:hypothetical protein